MFNHLSGVYAAALTPLKLDYTIDLQGLPSLLDFLAARGCHGALLFGTTGEGPSFSPSERFEALCYAADWRKAHPEFRLFAGTGTPSMQETIDLTHQAFDLGMDGVVVLPPYYFRKVSDQGLLRWFEQVIEKAVPEGWPLFGYHFPGVSGVPLSLDLLTNLSAAYPRQFAGIKDSSGDPEYARMLGERFAAGLVVLTGNDRLFSLALQNHASGCITAMANLYSPDLRLAWDAAQRNDPSALLQAQERLSAARMILDRYPPFPPLLKSLLSRIHGLPRWAVRPPLLPLPADLEEQALVELEPLS